MPYLDELDAVAEKTARRQHHRQRRGRLLRLEHRCRWLRPALAGGGLLAAGEAGGDPRRRRRGPGGRLCPCRAGAAVDLCDLVPARSEKLAAHLRSLAGAGAAVRSYGRTMNAFGNQRPRASFW